jgi:hypothetical protein
MVLSLALVSSCSPSDGADGANGIDGAPGPAGQDGTDGQDGQDGNANVISSAWIPVNFGPATTFGIVDIVNSNINAANMADAAFLVYGRIDSDTVIVIPFVFANRSYYYGLFASTNTLRMIGYSLDGSSQVFADFTDVRFVIIPPGPGFTGGGTNDSNKILADLENQGVDVSNYEEVAAHFNLQQ